MARMIAMDGHYQLEAFSKQLNRSRSDGNIISFVFNGITEAVGVVDLTVPCRLFVNREQNDCQRNISENRK